MARIVKKRYPLIPLRDMVVLPGMMVHFDIGRSMSIKAVEKAIVKDQKVFLTLQKDENVQEPGIDDINVAGCVSQIKQVVKLSNGILRVYFEGLSRAVITELEEADAIIAVTRAYPLSLDDDEYEFKAIAEETEELISEYGQFNPQIIGKINNDKFAHMETMDELISVVASNFPLSRDERQAMLDAATARECFLILAGFLKRETKLLDRKSVV